MVKCSKCGAFSYPELTQCNMCGASLLPAAPAKVPPAPASPETEGAEQSFGPSPTVGKADGENSRRNRRQGPSFRFFGRGSKRG